MKAQSLQDLKALKAELARERAAAADQARQRALGERRQHAEHTSFMRAMQGVEPLRVPQRNPSARPPAQPVPQQRQRDDAAVLRESLSDAFDASTLLHVDGHLSFRRPGIGPDVPARLRRGHWAVQAQLDLHGLRSDAARAALAAFLRDSQAAGLRCVRVVHGKGLGSPGGVPVLKRKVHGWLMQKDEVLAFVQPRAIDGGAGALLVLLAARGRGG